MRSTLLLLFLISYCANNAYASLNSESVTYKNECEAMCLFGGEDFRTQWVVTDNCAEGYICNYYKLSKDRGCDTIREVKDLGCSEFKVTTPKK